MDRPFKYKYFKSEITGYRELSLSTTDRIQDKRFSHPKIHFVLLFSQMSQTCSEYSGAVTAPSKTHQPCLLSGRAQNCYCLISLVGFYVASGPLVPIKVSSSITCPVLVLHSTCLQLNHAVGSPSTHPDCLCFMRPDHNGVLLSLWWIIPGPSASQVVMGHRVELRTQPTLEFCLKLSIQEIDFGGRSNSSS